MTEVLYEDTKPAFQIGDLVQLKSGSPKYTVVLVSDFTLRVMWSAYDTQLIHTHDIPTSALVKANQNDRRTRTEEDRPY